VVICLERGADLHMAQLMPLPLTVSCFSKIEIGLAFLVPAHPGSPGQRAVKRVCVLLCIVCCTAFSTHICFTRGAILLEIELAPLSEADEDEDESRYGQDAHTVTDGLNFKAPFLKHHLLKNFNAPFLALRSISTYSVTMSLIMLLCRCRRCLHIQY